MSLSKGSDEENPREIQREKLQHYREVTSFAAQSVSGGIVISGIVISAIVAVLGILFIVGGILLNLFGAF